MPALFALDAQAELADRSLINLGELLDQASLPLVVALRLPVDATSTSRWGFVEKIGWRAAFSPSRLVVALTAERPDGRYRAVRAAMSAAGLPARGLPGLQQVLQQVLQLTFSVFQLASFVMKFLQGNFTVYFELQ